MSLIDLAMGRIKNLAVMMPPDHGKSSLATGYFTAWLLGMWPTMRVSISSYEAGLALSWSRMARTVLEEYGPEVFGVRVSKKQNAADWWELEQGGICWAAGVGGGLTGKHPDILLVDDPVKGGKEANSEADRRNNWDWYRSVAIPRLQPEGRKLVIMTRWHERDLLGQILETAKATGEEWRVLRFPALAEKDDPLGREEGEALWPERHSRKGLELTRQSQGSYWWNALYQQRPAPEAGALFKAQHFRRYTVEDGTYTLHPSGDSKAAPKHVKLDDCKVLVTADLAISTKETADYTVMCVWAVTKDKDLILLDLKRDRIEAPDQEKLLVALHAKHRPHVLHIESNQYQAALVQYAIKQGLPARAVKVNRDKFTRATAAAARMEAGTIYLPIAAPWLEALEHELLTFPNASHDDQVDNFSLASEAISDPESAMRKSKVIHLTRKRPVPAGVIAPWEED